MNIKQVIFINISFFISLTVLAADRPTQPVRTEVYRLERLDSVLLVDLAVDLTGVPGAGLYGLSVSATRFGEYR